MKQKHFHILIFSFLTFAMLAAVVFQLQKASAASFTTQGQRLGVAQSRGARPNATPQNMTWHNGPIMAGTVNVYAIYWEPKGLKVDANYNKLLNRYYGDVGGTGLYKILTQYKGSNGTPGSAKLAGSWVDSSKKDAYPSGAILSPADILQEVQRAMKANKWSAGASNYFPVYTSEGAGSSVSGACAYHTISNGIIYAHDVYPSGGCLAYASQSPNNCAACDASISISSHEQFEAASDPDTSTGWFYQNTSGEIGDLCTFGWQSGPQFGNLKYDNGKANQKWNGHFYIVQEEWNNAKTGCTQSGP